MDSSVSSIPQSFAAPETNGLGGGIVAADTQQQQQSTTLDSITGESVSPPKRKPGRPKGSGKKQFLTTDEPKVKRPVGRPRKDGLPAGSLGVTKKPATRRTSGEGPEQVISSNQGFTQWRTVNTESKDDLQTPKRPIITPTFAVDPSLTSAPIPISSEDDWADLLRTKPNTFLSTLLSFLSAPNPVSTVGPSVEEAFKSNLVSLSSPQAKGSQSIPSLYSILKTFWLPSSPAYFSLTASASTARTPPEHRFLYWDPQPLVFNGISCPICSYPLVNKGRIRSGPIKVYDLDKPFFIIGCEYVCKSSQCTSSSPSSSEGRKFASTDPSILRSLPAKLKDEFPAHLLQGESESGTSPNIWNWKAMGVSRALWNMVKGGLKLGLSKEVIVRLIRSIQNGVPDEDVGVDGMERREEEEEDADAEMVEEQIRENVDVTMAEHQVTSEHTNNKSALNETYTDAWRANAVPAKPSAPSEQPEASSTPTPTSLPTTAPSTSTTPTNTTGPNPSTSTPTPVPTSTKSPAPGSGPVTATPNPMPPPTQIQAYGFPSFSTFSLYPQYGYIATAAAAANGLLSHAHSPSTPASATQSTATLDGSQASQSTTSTTNLATIPANANPLKRPYTAFIASNSSTPHLPSPSPHPNAAASNTTTTTTATSGSLEPVSKRAPRHCCKCGSQDCKGKGGRSFCMNACQDCGKLECKGRNSRRPDKTCAEAWG